jgi:hypothetical protein
MKEVCPMRCDECGKDFRRTRAWQHFCSPKCRNDYHNHETSRALHEAKDEQYRREVLANEARINGFTHIELVANPPPQLTGPFILWLHHDCSPQ